MSYWRADDSVRVGQKKISIPSENGLEYKPGQKIQLFVDPSTRFLDGKESYLSFDFKINLPSGVGHDERTRLQLDKCSSTLIKNIRIYDGSRGQLLEELSEYASYVSVKYDYDKDKNDENLRALREGCHVYQPANRGTEGTTQTPMANTITNPYFKKTSGDQNASFGNDDFLTAKLCLPLHTGIFAQSETIFPVMMTQGLYIEIDLNEADNVLTQLDSVNRDRRTELNPYFHSLNGSSAPDNWVNGSTSDTFYVSPKNGYNASTADDIVARFPFVVGETINFCRSNNNGSASTLSALAVISEINLSSNASADHGLIEVKLASAVTNNTPTAVDLASEQWVMYSSACERLATYDASYTISNVNLIVSQVMLDPGYERGMIQKVREGKAIEFDIMTYNNYKHSILASERQSNIQIFANNSRAKSLLIVPQDSSVYSSAEKKVGKAGYAIKGSDANVSTASSKDDQDTALLNNRSSHTGIIDYLSEYQYLIDGKRVPSRPISVKKTATRNSIDAFHLYELEKCLDNAGIQPKSFQNYLENFCFGRGFSAGGQKGAQDLRGKDLSVILKYQESTAPTKPKLFNCYVFGLRRLILKDNSIDIVM
jgi:hypothetical protein